MIINVSNIKAGRFLLYFYDLNSVFQILSAYWLIVAIKESNCLVRSFFLGCRFVYVMINIQLIFMKT